MTALKFVRSCGPSAADTFTVEWYAEVSESGLQWSAKRVLVSLGWDGDTPHTQPDIGFRTQRQGVWRVWCEELGIDLDLHIVPSAKSLRQKAGLRSAEMPAGGPVAYFTNLGLLCVLVGSCETRRKATHRVAAQRCLQLILSYTTLSGPSLVTNVPAEIRNLCADELSADNYCVHLQLSVRDPSLQTMDRVSALQSMLCTLVSEES